MMVIDKYNLCQSRNRNNSRQTPIIKYYIMVLDYNFNVILFIYAVKLRNFKIIKLQNVKLPIR